MAETTDTAVSRLLSLILRHRPGDFGVSLDPAGWTTVTEVLTALSVAGKPVTAERLAAIVAASDKQRFAISADGTRIRANQGHSVPVSLGHEARQPPPRLFHGTVARFLPSIRQSGLVRGRRHHVHLSPAPEQALVVGARRGEPVLLEVEAAAMHAAGHMFLLSPNGVWLTDHVPPSYLIIPE